MRFLAGLLLFVITNFSAHSQKVAETVDSTVFIFKKNNDAENFIYAFLDQYLAQPTEARLTLFDEYEKTIWRPLVKKEENLAYCILLCNKGYYLTHFGEIYKAIDAYEKAWRIFNDNKLMGFDIIEYCLKPLANNYSQLGDYTSAGNIVKNYLFQAEKQRNDAHVFSAFINLSIIYHETGKYDEAIRLLEEALALKAISKEKKGLVCSNLSKNYLSLRDLVKAKQMAVLAITLFKRNPTQDTPVQLVNVYSVLSAISLQEQNTKAALQFIKTAEAIALANPYIFKKRELAKLTNGRAEILKITGKYNDALKVYLQSLTILLPAYFATKDNDLPDASTFYAENTIKETLDGLADVYLKLDQPEKALACYDLSFTVENLLRGTFNYDETKLQQQIENRNRTEQALAILYALAVQSNDNRYVVRAFQLAEHTKAITLKEKIEDRYLRKTSDQDSLIKLERSLHFRHATLASEIAVEQMKQEHLNVEYVNELIAHQTNITVELKEIEKAIQSKYPNNGQPRSSKKIDLAPLQKKLADEQAFLIEYFTGKDALYIFKVDAVSIELRKVKDIESLKKNIIELNDLFSNAAAINNQIIAYKNLAFELFSALALPKEITEKNLILIPDGLLSVIPFDALLYENTNSLQYASFPFLLKKFTIAYQPSALLYSNYNDTPLALNRNGILAMFPVFENTKQVLQYSQEEAKDIKTCFEGKYLYQKQATKKNFIENIDKYSIVHLSTHASAGTTYEPPSITFIDSVLYLPQVYGLQMKPDLLVLSACETGVGTIVKGEGAISLARGFQFAGVKNIIFSLWKVNDYSTAALMGNFYRRYIESGSKAEALHQAKIDYLTDGAISNNHKSPYYWSAFVYYGNIETQPVDQNWRVVKLSILIFFVFLIVVMGFYLLRRKKLVKAN